MAFVIPGRPGKGDRSILCEAPFGPFRQNGPVPFSRALAGYRNKAHRRPEITKGHLECGDVEESRIRTAGAFHGLIER